MSAPRWSRPRALGDPAAPFMVVEASAGTGKTWFVIRRVVDLLLSTDATIDRIVVVTYTEKATAELRLRLRDLLARMAHGAPEAPPPDAGPEDVWILDDERRARLLAAIEAFDTAPISTIHGFCQRVLTDESFAARRSFDQVQIPDDAALRGAFVAALRERFARDPVDVELLRRYLADSGPTAIERLFAAVLAVYRSGAELGPADSTAAQLVHAMRDEVIARADRDKRRGGQIDFQDMLKLTADALVGAGGDALAARLATRYPWALIDEFQDTDPLQWQIIERVWGRPPARGLTVVGDPKQAIYSFRGGDVDTYLKATEAMRARDANEVVLGVCQRATRDLIDVVNTLITKPQPLFADRIRYDRPVTGTGAVELRWDDGAPVKPLGLLVVEAGNADAARGYIASAIADEIGRLMLAPGRRLVGTLRGQEKQLLPGDLMVLTRTNAESMAVASAIRARGVPCALAQAEHLFTTVEARDLLDLLEAIARPRDRSARLRAWMTDFFAVDPDHLSQAQELGDDHPLCARLHDWRALAVRLDYPRLFASIMSDSQVAERALASGRGERAVTNLAHVLEHLHAEVERSRCELPELVARLRGWIREAEAIRPDDSDVQRQETDRDAVQVMTIHRAKGLEAWVVFLACATFSENHSRPTRLYHDEARRLVRVVMGRKKKGKDDVDPIDLRADADQRAEDQRLAYVALTRARGRLYLPVFDVKPPPGRGGAKPKTTPRSNRPTPGGGYAGVTGALFDNLLAAVVTVGAERYELWAKPIDQPAPLDVSAIELPEPPPRVAAPPAPTRTGFVVTSYSRMKAQAAAQLEVIRDEVTGEDRSRVPPGPDELPGGAPTGHVLHEVLEHVDARAALAEPDPLRWLARPEVDELFAAAERRHGVAARHRPRAAALVHRALTEPIVTSSGLHLPPLGEAALAREVEFVFPLPDRPAADGGIPGDDRQRGFVKGFIDALARWPGDDRWFVIDYKSDVIDLSAEAAAAHVDEHYRLQAQLYGLAVASMMKLRDADDHGRRFGGLLYWFLRYNRIVHLTPSHADLAAHRAELAAWSFA